jgi:alkylhydroperoxidase/carboxymuconolactone decarboxylase family protein
MPARGVLALCGGDGNSREVPCRLAGAAWTGPVEETMETYYCPHDLDRFSEMGENRPELWDKFMQYYNAVFEDGALTEREKSLIALAVATAVQCPYCIDAYTKASLEKGADLDQLTEAVHVSNAIRGGASLVHGVQMRSIAEKLGM